MNAFQVLGLSPSATQEEVKQAYRNQVKKCHPDQFEDQAQQLQAQEKLVALNLAYEEALKLSAQRQTRCASLSAEEAVSIAGRMMAQGNLTGALGQMARAESKTDAWFFMQGQLMMKLKQFASAHQAFRAAVRLSPANNEYRAWALDAAVAYKKHQKLPYKVADWAQGLFKRSY